MKYEYATTYGSLYQGPKYISGELIEGECPPSNPVEPEGKGWEICGSAASNHKLYWFWRREKG
jgi:hypothetical protein